jgi:hypothetical protein
MNNSYEKDLFLPGQLVTVKANLPDKPVMVVKGREIRYVKDSPINHLKGIRCWWFSKNYELVTGIFNTKDLIHWYPTEI